MARRHFSLDSLKKYFSIIGANLNCHLTIHLIGGCALTFKDLKEATKDIDVVFIEEKELNYFKKALQSAGFSSEEELSEEYEMMQCAGCFENKEGMRFDLFFKRVVGKLEFSKGMIERAESIGKFGKLTVKTASMEDIFLFKGLATRADDVEDMKLIWARRGLNWQAIKQELEMQRKELRAPFLYSIKKLEEQKLASPIRKWLETS
ncbi:nucleotidyltransferase [Candidatus Micrarchaeota archaeon]|nr:nucleotidyltransferase [Candidatus Micrarchaeota archaeon]